MINVHVQDVVGATLVTVRGGVADGDLLTVLAEAIAEVRPGGPVVVEVSELTLTSPGPVRRLIDDLREREEGRRFRLVCSRRSGRRLLHQAGDRAIPVFASVEEAVGRALVG